MKYIRTKNGRILKVFKDNVGLLEENDGLTYYGENTVDFETSRWLPKSEVIKIADTIEDLCDEFVVVNNSDFYNGRYIYYQVYPQAYHRGDNYYDFSFEQIRTGRRKIDGTLYGAIWTDKGLIYVAKMNEKGELEVL